MSLQIELTNGLKNIKEDYHQVINCINQAICSDSRFIELTEQYTTTEYSGDFPTKKSNLKKICINIDHLISF